MLDRWLLKEYVRGKSEAAFAELVARHTKLVYSTCKRDLNDPQLAEDCTLAVFLILADKAPELRVAESLAGWLYCTARMAARNALKQERRRVRREGIVVDELKRADTYGNVDWHWAEPRLNEALDKLGHSDRVVLLLRFFDELSLNEIGKQLSITEDAARKRVSRALEKLRATLGTGTGVCVSAATLVALLSDNAAHAVPLQLTASLSQIQHPIGVPTVGPVSVGSRAHIISKGVMQTMVKMKLLNVGIAAGLLAALSTGALYGVHAYQSSGAEAQFVTIAPALDRWYRSVGPESDAVSLSRKQALDQVIAILRRQDAALNAKDINALMADVSPSCSFALPNGTTLSYAQIKQADQITLSMAVSHQAHYEIQSFSLTGGHAQMVTSLNLATILKVPGRTNPMSVVQAETCISDFNVIQGKWIETKGKVLSLRTTIDGKPVPST